MRFRWLLLFGFPAFAQCPYPCWTEMPASRFEFVSFEKVPAPVAVSPFEFSLPYPAQKEGGWSEQCNARENINVDLYRYNAATNTWTGPLTGPVARSPLLSYESGKASGRKGIGVQAAFSGKADSHNGASLTDAVFFHTDPCYRANTEFGFSRPVTGTGHDATVYFYYEANANCKPDGKCRVHGTEEVLIDQAHSVALATPAGVNSRGGADWLFEANLVNGGTAWSVHVRDPYGFQDKTPPLSVPVQEFWREIGAQAFEHGATGYVTATAVRNGDLLYSGDAPAMNVVKIWVAK